MPRWRVTATAAVLATCLALPAAAQLRPAVRNGDYIVAVINQELVTAGEVERRIERARQDVSQRPGARLPAGDELQRQALDALIEERVIVTHARDSGVRIDDADLDRAVQSIAQQLSLIHI